MINFLIILFFILAFRQLLVKLNSGFPIIELTIMLYVLQYLVAPLFEYSYNEDQTMAVSSSEYLNFTFVAILSFAIGLFSKKQNINYSKLHFDSTLASKLGRLLIVIGFTSQIGLEILPDAFKATVNFFVLFKTIGVYALIFSDKKQDKLLILLFSIQIAAGAILGAMLIEFIVFALFFAMFYSLKYQVTNRTKYIFFISSFIFITLYQGIKADYREFVWGKELSTGHKIALLSDLLNPETIVAAFDTDIENNESLIQTMHRLNQGWQTSKVIKHVPSRVDYQYGEEFFNDVFSSILPRALWANKRIVNDYQRFNHYTGYSLNSSTSMSMGVVGDFYLNFGKIGTVIVLFLFGFFISKVNSFFISKYVTSNPINLIWLPFIFSYLMRPGNEFYMVLNHLIKSVFVLFFVFNIVYPRIGVFKRKWISENKKFTSKAN